MKNKDAVLSSLSDDELAEIIRDEFELLNRMPCDYCDRYCHRNGYGEIEIVRHIPCKDGIMEWLKKETAGKMETEAEELYTKAKARMHTYGAITDADVIVGLQREVDYYRGRINRLEEKRYAHWIVHLEDHGYDDCVPIYYQCSVCGYSTSDNTPYCAKCGAKMGEQYVHESVDETI